MLCVSVPLNQRYVKGCVCMSCSDTVLLPGFLPSLVRSLLQHLLKLLAGAPETGPSSPWENPGPFCLPISRAYSVLKTVVLSHLGCWEAGLAVPSPGPQLPLASRCILSATHRHGALGFLVFLPLCPPNIAAKVLAVALGAPPGSFLLPSLFRP